MKYFIDTEFIEDGRTIDLISVGVVTEDGREFYAVSSEFDASKANEFVRTTVIPRLKGSGALPRACIRDDLLLFVGGDPSPEFWADYAAYDWVVICQLFGTMMDLPPGWPMFCRDFQQVLAMPEYQNAPLPYNHDAHNALADARWLRNAYFNILPWA